MKWLLPLILLIGSAFAQLQPTTTLKAETGNNTSTADTFAGTTNGNLPAGNVSMLPVRNYFPGFTGPIFVHLEQWWGGTNHVNIGQNSQSSTQIAKTVKNVHDRGFDGGVIDWYGYTSSSNNVSKMWLSEVTKYPGMWFALSIDGGTLNWYNVCDAGTSISAGTCTYTDEILKQINYIRANFFPSSGYQYWKGRPVVWEFGLESYSLDWAKIRVANPDVFFMKRNSGAFTDPYQDGAFEWGPADSGTTYFTDFVATARKYPSKLAVAGFSKGFDDSIASWSQQRKVAQQCGQRLLTTINLAAQNISAFGMVQAVTWDDYEEGTELETGVDNCFTITGDTDGTNLLWSVTGSESTIDHYEVFASVDGINLQRLAELPIGTRSHNVSNYILPAGTYFFYIKAVGKPLFKNTMSQVVEIPLGINGMKRFIINVSR